MATRIKNGVQIQQDKVVLVESDDSEFYQFFIQGSNGQEYEVIYDEGYIYCDCEDYQYRAEREMGSFLCKHCIKCLELILNHQNYLNFTGTEIMNKE